MTQQTQQQGQEASTQRPAIPTGQELYDAIMGHIEPELTTASLQVLAEKYADETPEERANRKQQYECAFAQYDQAYEGYIQTLQAQVDRHRRHSFTEVELEDRQEEEGFLKTLSHTILGPS